MMRVSNTGSAIWTRQKSEVSDKKDAAILPSDRRWL